MSSSSRPLRRSSLLPAVALLACGLAAAAPAAASDYALDAVPQLFGAADARRLGAAGVRTTADLLGRAATRDGRRALARATGIAEGQLSDWARLSDLMRLRGIGPGVARLLTAAGIDTAAALARANPAALAASLDDVNRRLAAPLEKLPSEESLAAWVARAQSLPPAYRP